jgi:RNA polymerase sigma-70 factor (ECF subfamily)
MPTASFKDELLAEIKNLRAFAISLSGSVSVADDLVQEALLRAWSKSERFQPGTSLRAWLFTILRNIYYSNYRKRSREVQDSDGVYARRLTVPGDQESHLDLEDFRKAMTKLPAEQREVLTLIGASGLSYEEAAVICGVEIGTIKSRLSRARSRLVELLGLDETAGAPVEAQVRRAGSRRRRPRRGDAPAPRSTQQSRSYGGHQRARRRGLPDDRVVPPFRQARLVARLSGMENERDASVNQPARDRRHCFGPKTEIENRHREIGGVRPQHRLVQGLAEPDNHRARLDQSRLQIHGQQRIVFNDEHSDAAQLIVIVHRLVLLLSARRASALIRGVRGRPLPGPNTRQAQLFHRPAGTPIATVLLGTQRRPAELSAND